MNIPKFLLLTILAAVIAPCIPSRVTAQNLPPVVTLPHRPDPDLDLGFEHQLHAAAFFFADGDMQSASNSVHRALSILPDDPQAEALRKLIEDQEKQDQQQDKNDPQQDQQQDQDQQDQQQQQDQQDDPSQQQQQQEQEQNQDQQQPPENQQPQEQPADPQESPAQDQTDRQMTPEEAKMLLDALRQADMMFPLQPMEDRSYGTVLRDW